MFDPQNIAALARALVAGMALGALYFGGLWWTVKRLPGSRRPLQLYFSSLAIRLSVAAVALYGAVAFCGLDELAAALVGFFAVRLAMVGLARPSATAEAARQEVV